MFCQHCGSKIPNDAQFCTHCGHRLNDVINQQNISFIHNSRIRKALKKDASNKPKTPLVIGALLSIALLVIFNVVIMIVTGAHNYQALPLWANIAQGIFTFIIGYIMWFGLSAAALKTVRGENISFSKVFSLPLENKNFLIGYYLFSIFLYIIIYLVFFIVTYYNPLLMGIISLLMMIALVYFYPVFDFALYIGMDNKNQNISFIEAFKKSLEITKGHRIEYYGTMCSFIGWLLLGLLTLGILYIWLIPYVKLTTANLYRRFTGETDFIGNERGLSNGAVIGLTIGGYFGFMAIVIISLIMFAAIIGFTSEQISNYEPHPDYYDNDYYIDDAETSDDGLARFSFDGGSITFMVPDGFTSSAYNTDTYKTYSKTEDFEYERINYTLKYTYNDYYNENINSLRDTYDSQTHNITEQEYTKSIGGQEVKCYTLKITAKNSNITNETTYVFYPLNTERYILINTNIKGLGPNNITDYVKVKYDI